MIRWLRWNLVCWRGRRCADLLVDGTLIGDGLPPEVVTDTTVNLWFQCAGCGTKYRREALLTGPDDVVHLDRMRVG